MEAWNSHEILKISKVRFQELIIERDKKIQEQREYYYLNAPKQVIIQHDNEITVEYGRVKNVIEKTYNDFSLQISKGDFSSYDEYGMASKKKCQIINLENDSREFRVVFGISAIGVKNWDVIKFKGEIDGAVVIIPSLSSIGGVNTFNIAIAITVDGTFYPSITAAYELIRPELSYGHITHLIRDGMDPNEAFFKKKKLDSDQAHGRIVKMSAKLNC